MRQRTLLIALAAIAIVAAAGIVIVLQPSETQRHHLQGFTVSFAAAENPLGEDRGNQIRDWARIGLAAHLARQPTGPGRALRHQDTLAEVLNSPDTTSYLNESFRATLGTKDGPVVADALQQNMTVTVREVTAEKRQRIPEDDTANGCGD